MAKAEDYTVGWICAIETEYTASVCFLDEEYADENLEFVAVNDDNCYTLGRIRQHNVVIATLPYGEYGECAATGVLKDMLHTFPNIRVALMVGIGGGAPNLKLKRDIRLGDIVVSTPGNGNGGVYQYDFGKSLQGREFENTGYLSPPPIILRTAVTKLKSDYKRKGNRLEETIDNILQNNPNLQQDYGQPDRCTDKLYMSEVTHPEGAEGDCATICGDEPSKVVPRPERHGTNLVVHYGLIGSANQVMKDAILRDKLADEKQILCFEMEAAGLMNQFPCLIIRGICDYSDSHKNKQWQGYAAMTAAAYAKDLLCCIAPAKVQIEKKIVDVLSSVSDIVTKTHAEVHAIGNQVNHLALNQKREKIRNWLSPPDPSINYNQALQRRHKGTGSWFLEGNDYKEWKKQGSFLWLNGIPGCGKTILSSSIIHDLLSEDNQVIYFYFDFRDAEKQSFKNMVSSLVFQLSCLQEVISSELDSLFASCSHGMQKPTCENLCRTLSQMIERARNVYIILDALDECSKEERKHLLLWAESITKHAKFHLLVASRDEYDIRRGVETFATVNQSVSIQAGRNTQDIHTYIRWALEHDISFERWRDHQDMWDEIETELSTKANGM
ncbi:hypothetical protein ABW19_dt0201550 [Dactylella cylindrospora]|nr:hypothetical protein ABW19_dt0201550 [Dactylella cylindrospora]